MSTNLQSTKVLIYGNVFRDYRSQALVKTLLESGYHISLICPDFYANQLFSGFKYLYLLELLIKINFVDVIYLPPMNTRFIKSACWAAKIFRKKLIVEMYISIYDTFVKDQKVLKGKQIQPNSRQAKAMLQKDILALSESDFIIHTAKHELTYWEKLLNIKIDQNKVLIAPNFNISQLVHKKRNLPKDSFNICWWGTFIPLHGLENILQAMKILQKYGLNFTCNLFGTNNSLFNVYQQKIKLEQLDNCVSLRKDLSFADNSLPQYLIHNCDLALGIFGNTDKAENTVPNKLIEALSMGIPTLTMKAIALQEFFAPDDFWTCEASPDSIAQSIIAVIDGKASRVNWDQTRVKVLDTFNIYRYQEVIDKVLDKASQNHSTKMIGDLQTSVRI